MVLVLSNTCVPVSGTWSVLFPITPLNNILKCCSNLHIICIYRSSIYRAVASLTVPVGQGFHFPHFFLKFWSIFLIFPQTLLIFFLILALRLGELPTREGPGYATAHIHPLDTYHIMLFFVILLYKTTYLAINLGIRTLSLKLKNLPLEKAIGNNIPIAAWVDFSFLTHTPTS